MPQYKESGSNLDKFLSPYVSIIYKKPLKYSMKYPIFLKNRDPSITLLLIAWFFIIASSFGYAACHILERQGMRVV